MLKVEKYEDCLAELLSKRRNLNLLLGNGFSIAYDHQIFSYNALQSFIGELKDPVLDELFRIAGSTNLEVIMQQLTVVSELLQAFGDNSGLTQKVADADAKLRKGLIDAVKALHPEHVFTIPDESIASCKKFLAPFLEENSTIFTTNYDILLYWVLMRGQCDNAVDGFGYERENPEESNRDNFIYSEALTWGPNINSQNVSYLHGALHLFDTGINIEKEQYDISGYILDRIKKRMDAEQYPVFVTAGDGDDKLSQIVHNKYLSHCFDKLKNINGSLVAFGFQFGEYDYHIIDAINEAAHYGRGASNKLYSIYIGVYSEKDAEYIRSIKNKFKCKVRLFDSTSVVLWGK
jgi:hypothetical protein